MTIGRSQKQIKVLVQHTLHGVRVVKVTIVSPTYNEADNVPRLVHDVDAALSGIDMNS